MLWIVPHLFPSRRLLEVAAQGLSLPALETLLARGHLAEAPAEGYEAALCEAFGVARQQDWPVAPLTLAATGEAPGDAWWLRADPVHLQVMRDRIVLAGVPGLLHEEAAAFAHAIAAHFGDDFAPRPVHAQRWLLRCAEAPDLFTTPLSFAVGRDIDPLLPRGGDALRFRSRLNELQMLLHDHPINQAREARGELPVNSLWLWGGGRLPERAARSRALHASHEEARALGSACGATLRPLPERLSGAVMEAENVTLLGGLAASGQAGDAFGWREGLRQLERDWFEPLRGRLRQLGPQGLRVLDPDHGRCLHLHAGDAWRVWRRPRSLLDRLG